MQSVYRVSEGAGVAVTTAHYYTPSGRLIQRPWDDSFDEYLTYTMRDQDPQQSAQRRGSEANDAGRKVYSGGGIEPDRRFDGPIEGFNPTRFGRTLLRPQIFDIYAQRFTAQGRHAHHAGADGKRAARAGARLRGRPTRWLRSSSGWWRSRSVKIDEADWQKDLAFIKAMIRYEIDLALFDVARRVGIWSRKTRRRSSR